MDKTDVINAQHLQLSDKIHICNTMERTGTTKLCAVCEEIIQNMTLGTPEILEDMASLKDNLDDIKSRMRYFEAEVEHNSTDIREMRSDEKKLKEITNSLGSIKDHDTAIKNIVADFSHSVTDITRRMTQLKQILNALLEYIDEKKTINLRKETNLPKKLVSELETIRDSINNDIELTENITKK